MQPTTSSDETAVEMARLQYNQLEVLWISMDNGFEGLHVCIRFLFFFSFPFFYVCVCVCMFSSSCGMAPPTKLGLWFLMLWSLFLFWD